MNSMTDNKRSLLNINISVLCKIILLFLAFLVRRLLIKELGNEYNGINSLFLNILGILSVAELGIGTAITFCMYKPIVDNNLEKVSALFHLMKKAYVFVAFSILTLGVIVSLFLPILAKDYTMSKSTLYVYFYMFLLSSFLTYFSGAKSSLICAHKNNFLATIIFTFSIIIQYTFQIISLIIFKSFHFYLISKSIFAIIQYTILTLYCRKKYYSIISSKGTLDEETKKIVKKSIGALFLHQITANIFSSIDGLVISSLFGLIILGKYSNYILILTSMNEVLKLFFSSISSIIGQYMVKNSKEEVSDLYVLINDMNVILGIVFYLGYYSIVNELISLIFGANLLLDNKLVMLLTITYFIQFLRQACSHFKDGCGLFYKDRYLVLIAAILNIVFSIIFAFFFDIYGVIIATLLLILTIYLPVDSYLFHKYKLEKSFIKDLVYKLLVSAIFIVAILIMWKAKKQMDNLFVQLIINGLISLVISFVSIIILCAHRFKKNLGTLKKLGFIKRREI